jgi:glycosyltransferase involved in cell wall biosynthesis
MSGKGPSPRLVHMCGFAAAYGGSFIPMLSSVLGAARERGWDVEAVFPPAAAERYWFEDLRRAGIPCRVAPSGSLSELTGWISDLLDESSAPSVIHAHFSAFDLAAVLAKRRRRDLVVVLHVHTVLATRPTVYLRNLVRFSLFARMADLIICPAQNIADGMIARGAPRRRVEVMPSPIEVDRFPLASREQRAAARAELEIPEDRSVLLHFGRDRKVKGTDLFIEAARRLAARDDSIYGLIHVGDALGERQYDRELLPDSVHLIEPLDEIRTLFHSADVLVAPSHGEGMPFAVVECLSSGTPVVASDLPGHRMLARGVDACTVVPWDAGRIASATRRVLDRPAAERDAAAAQAHAWIRENLRLEAATQRVLATYDRLLAMRGLYTGSSMKGTQITQRR